MQINRSQAFFDNVSVYFVFLFRLLRIDLRIVAKPTAGKSCAAKPGDDVRTASCQLPDES